MYAQTAERVHSYWGLNFSDPSMVRTWFEPWASLLIFYSLKTPEAALPASNSLLLTKQYLIFSNCFPRQMVKYVNGRTHCQIFLSECFMKYYFNVSLTVCLNIKFQLNCFFKLSWNILRQGYTMKILFQRI